MAVNAVLFDLGGTLLHYHDSEETDTRRPFRRVTMLGIQAVLAQMAPAGTKLPAPDQVAEIIDRHIGQAYRAALEKLVGASVEAPVRAGLAELGINSDDSQWNRLRPFFYSAIEKIVSPRAGVRETVAALHNSGYALGLISNTFWAADIHDRHLAEYHLLDFFPIRLYSCDLPHAKPHPAIFQAALDRLGVSPRDAVYVGDRPDVDVAGSQKVGMRGILIHSPYETSPLNGIAPNAIIDELPELPAALEHL